MKMSATTNAVAGLRLPPPEYFVQRRAAIFRVDVEWHSAPVDEQGVIDWGAAESLDMPDLFELGDVLRWFDQMLALARNL